MIGRIQGQLLETSGNVMLIDVGGVAYEVEVTSDTLARHAVPAGQSAGEIVLHTHFIVREDAQQLFGFASRVERDVFRDLIRINGVGPRLGLAIVSSISLRDLAQCVRARDVSTLTRVPGVGKKTAERLLVELKDRLGDFVASPVPVEVGADRQATREAEDALVSLGYRPAEAQQAVAAVQDTPGSAEDLLRAALRQIARQAEPSA